MRLPFLILTPACVALGFGTALWTQGYVAPFQVIMVLVGAISAHISVNAFNEYFDFKSGLDFHTQRTPFSGGSGTLPANPHMAKHALVIAIATFTVVVGIGFYFLIVRGPALLAIGTLGLFLLIFYTPWIVHHPYLCLVAPGLGFGPLMVIGTHVALTGSYSWTAFVASLIPFFLVSNLLLLNQFPDVEADRDVGRRHLPIVIGRRASSLLYVGFLVMAYLSLILGVYNQYLPQASLVGLATSILAVPVSIGSYRYAENVKKLIPSLGINVAINILTPILVSIGLII
ncbi:MAG: prenyltransferase [Gammaproteobacteria bacterium]|nr:prenyltransferase [Gammaproteobacteria bacterium]